MPMILKFLSNPKKGFQSYWYDTSDISSLVAQFLKISNSYDFINYKDTIIYASKSNLTTHYEISSIPREILLFQTGYLTLRKEETATARLVLPNSEMEDSLFDLYRTANKISG